MIILSELMLFSLLVIAVMSESRMFAKLQNVFRHAVDDDYFQA